VDVRAEATSDWSAVRTVHLAAFGDHGQVVANLVDDLRDAVARDEGLSLVAEERKRIVGHVQVLRLPAYEPWMTGTLVYAEPFWRHDAVGLREPNA
jgi:predicted N-acetyltransferase YhbS